MPVFIDDKDAFEKMCRVEGEHWKQMQKDGCFGDCSFAAFLEVWKKIDKKWRNFARKNPASDLNFGVDVNGMGAIYGEGGWNRYTVRYSGEILLIEGSVTLGRKEQTFKKARAEGFRIFPDDLEECLTV